MVNRLRTDLVNATSRWDTLAAQVNWHSEGLKAIAINVADHGADPSEDAATNSAAFAAALAELPAEGGTIIIPPGEYEGAFPAFTGNERIYVHARGATLIPPASGSGFTINQGVGSNVDGIVIDGARVDGANGNVIAFQLEDTNNAILLAPVVEDCLVGIDFHANDTNAFVEGTLVENPLIRNCQTGIRFRITSGTGSFAQTIIRGLKIVVGGTSGKGIVVPENCVLQRSWVQGTIWIGTDETAIDLDGSFEDAMWRIAIEGAGGSTGNVGALIGANIANDDQFDLSLLFTGTMATQVSISGSPDMNYMSGGARWVQLSGNAGIYYRRHGDTTDRFSLTLLTAGPKLEFGTGAIARDVNLYRSAANVLTTDDQFVPVDGVVLKVVAGAVSDSNFTVDTDGLIAIDSSNGRLYVRYGGAWHYATLDA